MRETVYVGLYTSSGGKCNVQYSLKRNLFIQTMYV